MTIKSFKRSQLIEDVLKKIGTFIRRERVKNYVNFVKNHANYLIASFVSVESIVSDKSNTTHQHYISAFISICFGFSMIIGGITRILCTIKVKRKTHDECNYTHRCQQRTSLQV